MLPMSFPNYPRGKGPKEHLNGDSVKRTRGRPKGTGLKADKTNVCHQSNRSHKT